MEKLNAYRTAQMKCALAVIDAYLANVPEVVKLVKSFDGKSFNGRMNSALRNISCALDKNTDDAHGNLKIISISFQPWPIIEKYSSECRTLISLEDMKPLNYLRFFIIRKQKKILICHSKTDPLSSKTTGSLRTTGSRPLKKMKPTGKSSVNSSPEKQKILPPLQKLSMLTKQPSSPLSTCATVSPT